MTNKPKKESELKCPLSQEQKEKVKEVADTVDIHIKIAKKFTGNG